MLAVIDHPQQVEWLTAAVQPGDPRFGVLVDVDVGQARTGTVEIADGVQRARVIAEQPKLKFEGIQASPVMRAYSTRGTYSRGTKSRE